jgi:putative ABC transport system permease protein
MLESLWLDLRYAARTLRRHRAFAAAAILMLAFGVAATTDVFALIEGVLLRPLPVREQDRLIVAWRTAPTSDSAAYPFGRIEIERVAAASRLLESAAGVGRNGVDRSAVRAQGVDGYANVGLVTGEFFHVLGVEPILGRAFTSRDDAAGAAPVVAITSGYWQRRYGGASNVIGRQLVIGDRPFTIVAVMPSDLDYPRGVDVWRTTGSVATDGPFGDAARREVNLVGRLRPGVTVAQAAAELSALNRRLAADAVAGTPLDLRPVVRSFVDVMVGSVRPTLFLLFAAVAFVLVIAMANVANLLLVHAERQRREMAIRASLGASGGRIVRQLAAQSAVLSAIGGIAGVIVAWWSLPLLLRIAPGGLPRAESVHVDALVVTFSVAVMAMTALGAALVPASMARRLDPMSSLRAGGAGADGRSARSGRRTLVVLQVALALVVLTTTGLLVRTVFKLQAIDLGVDVERLILLDWYVPPGELADRARHAQFLDRAIAALEALPSVSAATPVNIGPFSDSGWDLPHVTAEGQDETRAAANPSLNLESIYPNYFDTLQIRLVRGRPFTTADRADAPAVAIVSEDVAARLWPGEDAIGKRLKMGGVDSKDSWRTVVGVARQTRYRTLTTARPTLYLPAPQFLMTATNIIVRTTASAAALASVAAERVRMIDGDVRLVRAQSFDEILDRPLARPRFAAFVVTVFGAAALLLATVGLYAVLAASVRQRDREIAVRVALGATAASVRRLVFGEALGLVGAGTAIGIAGAIAAATVVRTMLFEVNPFDPLTTIGVALLLAAAAGLASYLPMRRAAQVDPAVLLRSS